MNQKLSYITYVSSDRPKNMLNTLNGIRVKAKKLSDDERLIMEHLDLERKEHEEWKNKNK